jgi:hypothetical protein
MKLPQRLTAAHYLTCQNPACRRRKAVHSPGVAKRQRFCSRQCGAKVTGYFSTLPKAEITRLAKEAAQKVKHQRWATVGERLARMTAQQLYRTAYRSGWKAGIRYMQRWGSGSPAQGTR